MERPIRIRLPAVMRLFATALAAALLVASCRTGGELQPIVIDLSGKTATPQPAATAAPILPSPSPTSTPTQPAPPTSAPAATATPVPSATTLPAAPPAAVSSERALSPERVAQERLDAFNRRDLEALLRRFAPDAQLVEDFGEPSERGLDRIRDFYARRFAESPGARASVSRRIAEGSYVVEHERLSGLPGGRTESAIVIYRIEQGKIRSVRILR